MRRFFLQHDNNFVENINNVPQSYRFTPCWCFTAEYMKKEKKRTKFPKVLNSLYQTTRIEFNKTSFTPFLGHENQLLFDNN